MIIPNQIFAGFNAVFGPLGMIIFQNPVFPNLLEFLILILVAILSIIGQIMRTRALQLEKAGKVSILNYTSIVFSYFFDNFLFQEKLHYLILIGSLLILLGALLLFILKH